MQSGLWTKTGHVPPVNVSVQGRIMDFIAEVTVSQRYSHNEQEPVEAIFKFPLDLFGALSGFEVILDGGKIVAEVQKRQKVESLAEEKTDFIEDQPNLFICNIGTLQPGKEVELKLTYVTELAMEGHALRFMLPSSTISPNSTMEEDTRKPSEDKKNVQQRSISVDLDLSMTSTIQKILSPTHSVEVLNLEKTKATVKLNIEKMTIEKNFILLVNVENPHTPWSMVEQDEKSHSLATMLSFFPKFNSKEISGCEIIFLVDCSSSVTESDMEHVQSALQLFLRSLPPKAYFNIILFGETFQKLFETSVPYNDNNLEKASDYVKVLQEKDLGGTDIYKALCDIYSSTVENNLTRQIFVITDGQVPNTNQVISLVRKHSHNTRVFTFGIGDRVSEYLVIGMALAGCGEYEFVIGGGEELEAKVMRQLKRALQPALTDPHLDWNQIGHVTQAPERLRTIFNGDNLLVYGFLDSSAQPGDVTLNGNTSSGQVSFSVHVDPKNSTTGRLMHVLAARARIRDLEELEDEKSKEEIIRLGTLYGLASRYTSFVAILEPSNKTFSLHSSLEIPKDSPKVQHVKISLLEAADAKTFIPSSPSNSTKKIYSADFLLRFQPVCTDLPEGLSPNIFDIILGTPTKENKVPKSPNMRRGNKGSGKNENSRGSKKTGGRKEGGKHSRNPSKDTNIPIVQLVPTEGRWERPKNLGNKEEILKNAKGILNRMTLEKFELLYAQLKEIGINDLETLDGVIRLVFDKAVSEPHFCTLYANLCSRLAGDMPSFSNNDGSQQISFRRLLLDKCQEEFEGKHSFSLEPKVDPLELEELEMKTKRKSLGNVKFIGELYKERMLPEKIMHECIKKLLTDMDNPSEEDIESLCKLITTVGESLDHPSAKLRHMMEEYFDKIRNLTTNIKLASRLKFMLQDLLDLRANKWMTRKKSKEAKTLATVRAETLNQDIQPDSPNKMKRSGSREALKDVTRGKGTGLHRSASDSHMSANFGDWETAGTNRKGGRGQGKGSNQGVWEVQGGNKYGNKGRGIKSSPGPERYAPKVKNDDARKEIRKGPTNIFSALPTEEVSNTPKSALRRSGSSGRDSPSLIRKEVIIQTPREEASASGNFSEEDLESKTGLLLEEYLASGDQEEAMMCIQELNSPHYIPEVIYKTIMLAIEKKERERDDLSKLLSFLHSRNVTNSDNLTQGLTKALEIIEDIDIDIPSASKYLSSLIGKTMTYNNDPLPLSFFEHSLDHLVESGKASEIAFGTLTAIQKINGEDGLLEVYENSKLNFANFFPSDQKSTENIEEILREKGLEILIPGKRENSGPSQKDIIMLQTAEGFWRLNGKLADVVGKTEESLRSSVPENLGEQVDAWATILALFYLKENFLDLHQKGIHHGLLTNQ